VPETESGTKPPFSTAEAVNQGISMAEGSSGSNVPHAFRTGPLMTRIEM